MDEKLLYRVPEVQQACGLSRTAVYELIWSGQLPVVRFGRAVRVRREDLIKMIADRAEATARGN